MIKLTLPYDPSAQNADNIIVETHAPATGHKRLLVPRRGDFFFDDTLALYDNQTNTLIPRTKWRPRDLCEQYLPQASTPVYSVIELDADTPADVRLVVHYIGGEGSLSTLQVLDWLSQQNQSTGATITYEEVINAPKYWKPEHHKHLLDHIYYLNPLVDSLKRVRDFVKVGTHDQKENMRETIDRHITGLRDRVILSIEGLIDKHMTKWEESINTFYLGLDNINNYGLMTEQQALDAADLNFAIDDIDEAYVDLRGLGKFSKRLFEQYVQEGTGLGNRYALLREPTRGNLLAAKVGEVYRIPSPHESLNALSKWPWIWPKNYPSDHSFVVSKVAGNEHDLGGVLMGFNPVTGDSWTGYLRYEEYAFKIEWEEQFNENSTLQIGEVFKQHFDAKGPVHGESAVTVGLSELESRQLVSIDEVLSRTNSEGLHTVASFLYLIRAALEGVELPLDDKGLVDLESNPMLQPKIIFAPCEPVDYAINTPERTWCQDGTLYGTFKRPDGVLQEVKIEDESKTCADYVILAHGTSLGKFCDLDTFAMKERFSDGRGGSYIEVVKVNDPLCGYKEHPPEGTVVNEYCEGVNRVRDVATGTGTTKKVVWMVNTHLCNGERGDGVAGEGNSGGTPGGGTTTKSIVFKTTHRNIYVGTHELLSATFSGFNPNEEYSASIWNQAPVYNNNKPLEVLIFKIKMDAQGKGYYELPREDTGVVPRASIDTWMFMESDNVESNHIIRNFLEGQDPNNGEPDGDPIDPPDTGLKDEEGNAIPPNTDVDGNDRAEQPWPPKPQYNPVLVLASNQAVIYPNDVEHLTAELTGFWANTEYVIDFWAKYPDGRTLKTHSATVMTNAYGNSQYGIHVLDDGVLVPRGDIQNWIAVGSVKSPNLIRTFKSGARPSGSTSSSLLYTSSNSVVAIGTAYTETIIGSGLKPNTKYTLILKGGYFDGQLMGGERFSTVVTADAQGKINFARTLTENGTTAEASWTLTAYLREGNTVISSNSVTVVFTKATSNTPPTGVPRLDYESSRMTIRPGDTETHTVRLTNGGINKTYTLHFIISGSNLNNGQELVSTTATITTNALGVGTYSLQTTDDGVVPRGDYNCWVSVPELYVKSSAITRSFVNTDGSTGPAPNTGSRSVVFATTLTTIDYGDTETQTITISGFTANKTIPVDLYIQSPALNNGGQAIKSGTTSISTNSRGEGTTSLTLRETGNTPPGTYLSWASVEGVDSAPVNRTFKERLVVYTPTTTFSTSHTTIQTGVTEKLTATISGGKPSTRYTLEFWNQGSALFSGLPHKSLSVNVVTDVNGNASYSTDAYDNGTTVPRGTYSSWSVIGETGAQSRPVTRNFVGAATSTTITFNPTCAYWTSASVLAVGTREVHNYSIAGCLPNTRYVIEFWINGTSLGNYQTKTETLTTNTSGNAAGSFTNVDDGVTPRGSYLCWVSIRGTNATSAPVTRTFL